MTRPSPWSALVALALMAAACGADGADHDTAGRSTTTADGTAADGTTVLTTTAPTTDATAGSAPTTTTAPPAASPPPTTAVPATAAPTTAAPSAPASIAPTPSPSPPGTEGQPPEPRSDGFVFGVSAIDAALRRRMEPTSWRAGCPVSLDELRYLQIGYWGFDGVAHLGELVVNVDAVDAVSQVFAALWAQRFPIRSMRLIDDFGGDDFTSIEADNTSAFNCRFVAGTSRWSNHATGRAIDLNPLENPWVEGGATDHPGSVPYLDRRPATGVVVEGDAVTAAFDAVGWGWGGRWGDPADYQHFSASGS